MARDGHFLAMHFHSSTVALVATLEYALVTGNQELLEVVRRGYDFGKAYGDGLTGFFPEVTPVEPGVFFWHIHRKRAGMPLGNVCETCEVADMVVLALKMSRAGLGDYWEDVDHYVRNQFVEQQMLRTDWIDTTLRAQLESADGQEFLQEQQRGEADGAWGSASRPFTGPPEMTSDEDVGERAVGSFAGWAAPNDFAPTFRQATIMHCCTGKAVRALAYAWDAIVTGKEDGTARVNLILNRASPWLDVNSHLPYEGRVDLRIKAVNEVAVRLPEGTPRGEVRCQVNGTERRVRWDGNYVTVAGLKPEDRVTVTFPQQEGPVFRYIGENMYRLTLKGNTVIDIDPEGTIYPLYQRDHYRADKAPLKQVTRFVSDETFQW